MNRNAVLKHLEKLRAMRIIAPIPDAKKRSRFLSKDHPRCCGQNLPEIVVADLRQILKNNVRSLLSGVDSRALNVRQKRPAYLRVVVRTNFNLFHLLDCLGLQLRLGQREKGCQTQKKRYRTRHRLGLILHCGGKRMRLNLIKQGEK
jgi:hypothetical protein